MYLRIQNTERMVRIITKITPHISCIDNSSVSPDSTEHIALQHTVCPRVGRALSCLSRLLSPMAISFSTQGLKTISNLWKRQI